LVVLIQIIFKNSYLHKYYNIKQYIIGQGIAEKYAHGLLISDISYNIKTDELYISAAYNYGGFILKLKWYRSLKKFAFHINTFRESIITDTLNSCDCCVCFKPDSSICEGEEYNNVNCEDNNVNCEDNNVNCEVNNVNCEVNNVNCEVNNVNCESDSNTICSNKTDIYFRKYKIGDHSTFNKHNNKSCDSSELNKLLSHKSTYPSSHQHQSHHQSNHKICDPKSNYSINNHPYMHRKKCECVCVCDTKCKKKVTTLPETLCPAPNGLCLFGKNKLLVIYEYFNKISKHKYQKTNNKNKFKYELIDITDWFE
jgi:hypothetical protein